MFSDIKYGFLDLTSIILANSLLPLYRSKTANIKSEAASFNSRTEQLRKKFSNKWT